MMITDKCIKILLKHAESIYNAKTANVNSLGNSSNLVFELSTNDIPIILRISEYSRNKERHITFELNWLKYLSEEITEVIKPILSTNNKLYEIISVESNTYILCAFEKAPGRLVNQNNPNEWNEALFYKLGSIMGKIHKRSKQYTSGKIPEFCFQWNEDFAFLPEFNSLDEEELKIWYKLVGELEKLPKTEEAYGIIHNDLHQLNFFIEGEKIKIFDFDDCICSWYSFDIALTLFQFVSTISYRETSTRNTFAEKFMVAFLKGYKANKGIESFWIDKFDLFLRYRRICTYKFFKAIFSKEPINPHIEYLTWLRKEIIDDKPFINIYYQELYKILQSM